MSINYSANDSYSVEISHIYLDQPFSSDQSTSVEKFREQAPQWKKPHSEIILFDNYNVKEIKTSPESVFDELKDIGAHPKYYAFEKDLIQYSSYFIDHIRIPKVKRQYENYMNKTGKYPCSLLTSVWYLLRLGYIVDTKSVIRVVGEASHYEPADKLVNFLSSHFLDVEEKSMKLILASEFSQAINQIENVYFESNETEFVLKKDLA